MHVLSLFFADFQLFSPKCLTIYIYIYTGMYEFTQFQAEFHTFFIMWRYTMRIILDTDKKTITVPWNYQQKLDEINRIIKNLSGRKRKNKKWHAE